MFTQVYHVFRISRTESLSRAHSYVWRRRENYVPMGLPVCSLMSACFVVCMMHLVQVHCQNVDDDNDENVLRAMVARLQDTVDRQEQLFNQTVEQLREDYQRSAEQLQQQFIHTVEQLREDYQRSAEQCHQQFNHTVEQLCQEQQPSQEQLNLECNQTMEELRQDDQSSTEQTTLAEESMYYLIINRDIYNYNIPDLSVAPILDNIILLIKCSAEHWYQIIKVIVSFYTA